MLGKVDRWPKSQIPVIVVGLKSEIKGSATPFSSEVESLRVPGPEGFALMVKSKPQPVVIICGSDARGVLYGVGRLLRKARLVPKTITLPEDLKISTAPTYPLRGHQLGYRPINNTYASWDVAQFDQYIRELALFGCNSIELVPPGADDVPTSPVMKLKPVDMMVKMAEIIKSYGLDVWIWYPNMGPDEKYRADSSKKAETETAPLGDGRVAYIAWRNKWPIQRELAEREEIFRRVKYIDDVLIPAGDPGDMLPDTFFAWIDKVAPILTKYHPNARIWVAPQHNEGEPHAKQWMADFYRNLNWKPSWLHGVAFSSHVATPVDEMRKIVDKDIPIRHYPDITHNLFCGFPIPNWDLTFALTEHRECINPRPVAMKTIHNLYAPYTCGSITYSEGIHDDVNKFVWADQDWDPSTPVIETLRDYGRLFINSDLGDQIAQGIMAEERNWEGPLAVNQQVDVTLEQWRRIERMATPEMRGNYRYQMCMLRAYYDAYIKRRLIHETELEASALEALRIESPEKGTVAAINDAESILQKSKTEPVALDYRKKCDDLNDALFESIGAKFTMKMHVGYDRVRGAFMDGIDQPLNNSAWLVDQFRTIRTLAAEPARIDAVENILNWRNPGPGGYYDDLGAPCSEGRISNLVPWEENPGNMKGPFINFPYDMDQPKYKNARISWRKTADVTFGVPLNIRYENLDPTASYSLRATYSGGWNMPAGFRINNKQRITINPKGPFVQEFVIPKEATANGRLELTYGSGGVAELWLIRHPYTSR